MIMNRHFVFLCVFFLCVLSGCDRVRGILGMATSEDIEKARKELALRDEKERKERDSIAVSEMKDTLEVVQKVLPESLDKRYYIIIGSFKVSKNTRNLLSFLKEQGYVPRMIPLKNGYDMVALGGYDGYSEARGEVNRIEQKEVCPYDVWIYDTKQQLHK